MFVSVYRRMEDDVQSAVFHRQNKEFMCCNGKIHSKTGSAMLALCAACLCLGALCLLSLEQLAPIRHYAIYIYLGIFAIVILSLLFALKTERELFLLPYIAFSITNIFLCIITSFFAVWSLSSSNSSPSKYLSSILRDEPINSALKSYVDSENVENIHEKASIMLASFSLVIALLSIPIFLFSGRIVYQCYNYFDAYHKALKINEANKIERV